MTNHTAQIIQLFAPRLKKGNKIGSDREPIYDPREIERKISAELDLMPSIKGLIEDRVSKKLSARLSMATQHRQAKSSDTAENQRLRSQRYDVWRQADAVMDYWRAAMKMHTAISCMQNFGAVVDDRHPFVTPEDHGTLVAKWRLAWAKLMLTPAANSNHVRWKNMQLIAKNYEYTGLKPERIQQAIDADVEWLEAHPVRGCKRKPSNSGQQP
jgi:hypothetical protein